MGYSEDSRRPSDIPRNQTGSPPKNALRAASTNSPFSAFHSSRVDATDCCGSSRRLTAPIGLIAIGSHREPRAVGSGLKLEHQVLDQGVDDVPFGPGVEASPGQE